jgi:hypothetical protein
MKIHKIQFSVLILSSLFLSSCYNKYYSYAGNVHQQTIGHTKNEILRSYGVPNQVTDDGAGGSIMVYEKYTQTTVGGSIYGNGGIIGASQTSSDKSYCNLFLNRSNIVYDFKSNYGAQYNYNKCFAPIKTWVGVGISCILIYPAIVTVPWAIIAHTRAKKKGTICK